MKLFGHRGAAAVAPENTVASFARAMEMGADGVECDVRRTIDGELVLIHDDDLSRTTGAAGRASEMTLAQLRELDASGLYAGPGLAPTRVPTVEEVWEVTGGRVIFEIKGTSWDTVDARGTAGSLVRFLDGRDTSGVVVSSFDPAVLAVVRSEAPGVVTGLLSAAAFDPASVIEAAVQGSHAICFLPDAVVTASAIEQAHEAGRLVIPWTANDAARLRELAGWGADGVITDDPGAARAALG
jgi:glycerophosphoryl diester phosphodiesterase